MNHAAGPSPCGATCADDRIRIESLGVHLPEKILTMEALLARHLIERAVWSATSTEEAVRDGRPLPFNPNVFNQNDH